MTRPVHAFFLRVGDHDSASIRDTLIRLGLDEIWLRLARDGLPAWSGASCMRLELSDLREGVPLLHEAIGLALSAEGRTVLRLSADSSRQTVGYELFRDGKVGPLWAGNIASYSSEDDPEAGERRPARPRRSAEPAGGAELFYRDFTEIVGVDFLALAGAGDDDEDSAEHALPGSELLLRGRSVQLVEGMGRWPELFRFHDRGAEPGEPTANGQDPAAAAEPADKVALLAFDPRATERLWRGMPAGRVQQYLRGIEPMRAAVLGPLAHALPEAVAAAESSPPERPLAAADEPSEALYEVLAMSTALVYMVGDNISYFDEQFFPLLSLSSREVPRSALADSLSDIESLDLLAAMAEVLPYAAPEGEMMDSFADEEIEALAPWAIEEGSYEGSLFLLDTARLRELSERFDVAAFDALANEFRRTWQQLADPAGDAVAEWAQRHATLDTRARARFEDTLVELQHLLALAARNELEVALLFYGG